MYFSGVSSENILIDDPANECMKTEPELFFRLCNDGKLDVRVFLDTPYIRFDKNQNELETSMKLIKRSSASISIGEMGNMGPVIFITKALVKAEFRKMKSRKFRKMYLAPLETAIRVNDISCDLSLRTYQYPKGDPINDEQCIQRYFNDGLPLLKKLYDKLYGRHSELGELLFRPSFYRTKLIKPDIAHLYNYSVPMNIRYPDLCIALGDFKKGDYKLAEGFKHFKQAIKVYKKHLADHRILRLQAPTPDFDLGPWSEKAAFAFVLRKYILDAFLCGTDRVYISDHQNFSGFFQYEFIEDQMIINYYVINDPETVAHGITLRSAVAGFFYKDIEEAIATKEKLLQLCEETKRIPGRNDLFAGSHTKKSRSDLSTGTDSDLPTIEEDAEGKTKQVIEANTKCRVIYDAPNCYPSLGIDLPSQVFVKMYHYSSRSWEMHDLIYLSTPTKQEYYRIFFNELEINKKIADSEYASHFPKLIASGYWNGLYERPMHIFEYLGEELPEEKWDKDKVYKIIKTRIKELHSLGISHNDVRIPNIHVSVSGKISLIDFGLSDANNIEARKLRDLRLLDEIFEVRKTIPRMEKFQNMGPTKENFENYPSLINQNIARNIENYGNEQMAGLKEGNKENNPTSFPQNEEVDRNEENYDNSAYTFHDVDPFFRSRP